LIPLALPVAHSVFAAASGCSDRPWTQDEVMPTFLGAQQGATADELPAIYGRDAATDWPRSRRGKTQTTGFA
jgi:hypothetical protein